MKALTVAGVVLVLLLASATVASSQSDGVTLVVTEYISVHSGGLTLRFTGSVANGAAGEVVDIVGRDCLKKPGDIRIIAQTQTRAGGGYQVDNPEQVSPFRRVAVDSGIELRARWNGRFSDPYVWKQPAPIYAMRALKNRRIWKVHFTQRGSAGPPTVVVNMKGKIVELQRRVAGEWVRYKRARFVYKPTLFYGAFHYEAVFQVPRRGLRLRAVLPAASAAPCYLKAVTPPWRS